ncbi:helix-turn-helix domain-containing protein [Rhodobacterales bacterium HKCCE4037]|nr:helix-turn-helix domain-containing protein [Rhodobacterales bacterium HKCCE4037]
MPHPIDLHVGQRIRERRWTVGMTQQQLAGHVGIKFQQIQKYETGANRVSASRLWDMAIALSVPVSHFFEGMEDDTSDADAGDDVLHDLFADKAAVELVRTYYTIPEDQRGRLSDLVRDLSDGDDRPQPPSGTHPA